MQSTNKILMIRPTNFNYNSETAVNNYYQTPSALEEAKRIQESALSEYNGFVATLRDNGVTVYDIEDRKDSISPDSIFPNNWISFHRGEVALYPMFAKNRRLERRDDIISTIKESGYNISSIRDYSKNELLDIFLEGTGSMVLDRVNKKIYCALSPRADRGLISTVAQDLAYGEVVFNAYQWVDSERLAIYHTNVMMAIANDFAIVCLSSIDNEVERDLVIRSLEGDGKKVINITEEQVNSFGGNALEVRGSNNEKILVLSQSAYDILDTEQLEEISKFARILPISIPNIEKYGGGSVRCMMAEIF